MGSSPRVSIQKRGGNISAAQNDPDCEPKSSQTAAVVFEAKNHTRPNKRRDKNRLTSDRPPAALIRSINA